MQAAITNKVMFTSPNAAARKHVKPEVLANPIAFPPDDYLGTKARFYEVQVGLVRLAVPCGLQQEWRPA